MTTSSSPDPTEAEPGWGSSYRLIASDKWKAKSASMGKAVTEALVECAAPRPGMRVLEVKADRSSLRQLHAAIKAAL